MYKSIKSFAFGGTAIVASKSPETYKNLATGYCLDSNAARQVYTHICNGGSYQKWL